MSLRRLEYEHLQQPLFVVCQKLKTTPMSINKGMDKETVVYAYNAVLFREVQSADPCKDTDESKKLVQSESMQTGESV